MRPKSNLQRKVTPKATMSLRTKRLLHQVQVGLAKPHDDLALPTSGSKDPKWVKEGVGNQSQKDGGRCLARRHRRWTAAAGGGQKHGPGGLTAADARHRH